MRPIWIFDLDNTLHDADHGIFPMLDQSITQYVMTTLGLTASEARRLNHRYYQRYGSTMVGMQRHHGLDPDHFLRTTHLLDQLLPLLRWEKQLNRILHRLPGRKFLLSNGPQFYVEPMIQQMAIGHHFQQLYGVERVAYLPKPHRHPFLTLCSRERLAPGSCIMVEDTLANLRTAKALGMRTVWISRQPRRPVWVDYHIRSITELSNIPVPSPASR